MPNINVMTWNSTGEDGGRAGFLHALITANPVVAGWQPDVIVIQEAQAAAGGAIWTMLTNLGNAALAAPVSDPYYHGQAPSFVGIPGEGYILMVSNSVAVAAPFAVVNLSVDLGVVAAIAAFPPAQQAALTAAVNAYRNPAAAQLTFAGRTVEFMTWHNELGPGLPFMLGVSAAVNYTAFFFLQSSNYYNNTLCLPGANNLGLIAADLNVYDADLATPTFSPAVPHLLPNWAAISYNRDHIAARRNGGAGGINSPNHGTHHYGGGGGGGTHDVLVAEVHWP